ncbi:DUF4238 domain-containing protein [Micromonospora sp. NPDC049662]|uniref:DUF4238 domain-containing protein n=1 Tax=Micromonospora sp. NPDC049662 TaxID=3155397 RepID=UPI0034227D35
MPPRRNHTVPQLWLNAFARNGRLVAHNRAGKEHLTGVKGAAVVAHFYRDESPAATDPQAVETYLANHIEDPAKRMVQDLVVGRLPSAQADLSTLKRLVAFQIARTPTFRNIDQQVENHLWPIMYAAEVVGELNKSRVSPLAGAELQAVFEQARRDAPAKPADADKSRTRLRLMLRTAHRLANNLESRDLVLASGSRRALLISDSPAVLWHPGGPPLGWTGALPDDADLLLPVAPNRLLIASRRRQGPAVTLTPELVKIANQAQVTWCSFTVYRHPDMRWPRDLHLGGNAPKLPAPRVTLSPGTGNPTFPAGFEPIADSDLSQLIKSLGGVDMVN